MSAVDRLLNEVVSNHDSRAGYGLRMMTLRIRQLILLGVFASVGVPWRAALAQATGKSARGDTTVAPAGVVRKAQPKAQPPVAKAPSGVTRAPTRLSPPLSPRRAFLYSAMLPGLGQSRLDRGTSGALFASVELAALVMVRRSQAELREVRRYRIDSLPSDFTVNGTTLVKSTAIVTNRYTAALEKTRKLHIEDWLAALAFNHLFAGADAFVAAQLWDTPISVSAMPRPDGAVFVASVRW